MGLTGLCRCVQSQQVRVRPLPSFSWLTAHRQMREEGGVFPSLERPERGGGPTVSVTAQPLIRSGPDGFRDTYRHLSSLSKVPGAFRSLHRADSDFQRPGPSDQSAPHLLQTLNSIIAGSSRQGAICGATLQLQQIYCRLILTSAPVLQMKRTANCFLSKDGKGRNPRLDRAKHKPAL